MIDNNPDEYVELSPSTIAAEKRRVVTETASRVFATLDSTDESPDAVSAVIAAFELLEELENEGVWD